MVPRCQPMVGQAASDAYTCDVPKSTQEQRMAEVAGHYLDRGTRISRYEVVAVIGAGGFGITYKAYDTRLLCEVAMKEYLPVELAARGSDQSTVLPRSQDVTEEYRHGLTRFLDEARVLAKFKNRHIVRVSDFMEVNGTAYLVMDYEEGQSLAELLKQRGGPLSEVEIKDIFIPILDGLKAVHDAGLLHRDIKPDNIYLRKHGPPVLLDFGAARQYAASQTRGLTAIVTPGYAPFEQYQPNAELGAWSDLYAVGATMYACITGSPPVDAITRHPGVKADPLPPAVEVGGDRYSDVLLRSIDWMLRPAANERPQSVDDVLPCIQGRAEPPSFDAAESAPTVVAPTVKVGTSTTVAAPGAGATIPITPATETVAAAPREQRSPPVGLIAGIIAVVLVSAGAGWWYVHDRNRNAPAVQTAAVRTDQQQPAQKQPGQAQTPAKQPAAKEQKPEVAVETKAAANQSTAEAKATAAADNPTPTQTAERASKNNEAPESGQQPSGESTTAKPAAAAEVSSAAEQADAKAGAQPAERVRVDEPEQAAPEPGKQTGRQPAAGTQPATPEISGGEQAPAAENSQTPEASQPPKTVTVASAQPTQAAEAPATAPKTQTTGDKNADGATLATETSPATKGSQATAQAPAAEPAQNSGASQVAPAQTAKKPGSDADKVTENVDEFLASLTSNSKGSKGGTTVASAAPDSGGAKPASSEVDQLLTQAATYMAASNLVEPTGRNARMIYQQVLAMDAGNKEARMGMNRIGDVYERAAAIMLDQGKPELARRVVERGLAAVPNHAGLLQLQARIQAQ